MYGVEAISKFFDGLPQSEHVVEGMDTQPIVAGKFGSMHFHESKKYEINFQYCFLITISQDTRVI